MSDRLVLIPVHNEAAHIRPILAELRRYYPGAVLFVEDGSTDGSRQVLEGLTDENVSVILHDKNLGYGSSLIDGFGFALDRRFAALVTMDCDWQHEPAYVPRFFEELELGLPRATLSAARGSRVDVISGSRYLEESPGNNSAPEDRSAINHRITELLRGLTPYQISDSFCGFKAYRVEALRGLCLNEPGYGFPVQFWMQAAKHNLTCKEIPVPRLYLDLARAFGGSLDDPEIRLTYYLSLIEKEKAEWNVASQS